MSKTQHNRSFAWLVTLCMLVITGIAMAIGLVGCNTQRRATKHIHKAVRIDKPSVDKYYADNYNPIESIRDSFIYIQGEQVILQDTVTMFDTVDNYITKTILNTVYKYRTDTIFKDREVKQVDKAKNEVLQTKVADNTAKIAQQKERINWWKMLAIAGWAIIIGRIIIKLWLKR
jgi:hypothetical protein